MEKIAGASRVFKCRSKEDITLTFTPHNTNVGVTFESDDGSLKGIVRNNTLSFRLEDDLILLRIFFHFEVDTGASYDIMLNGSQGGNFNDAPSVIPSGDLPPIRKYVFTT
jgi:hypothetical protein